MTALITSNIYSNYTADFAFLGGAISRFKPNKIVSSYSPTNTDINFLRDRVPKAVAPPIVPAKTKKKLGERLMGMLPQKKATLKPYSLRSLVLDDPNYAIKRAEITTANKSIKAEVPKGVYSPYQTSGIRNQTKTSKVYNSRVEARLKKPSYWKKQDEELVKNMMAQSRKTTPSTTPLKPTSTPSKAAQTATRSKQLIQSANETLDRTKNLARDNSRNRLVRQKQKKNRKGNSFNRENLTRQNPPVYSFRTENWRA